MIRKHLISQVPTSKGHLSQTRQHLQTTRLKPVDSKHYLDNIKKNIKALQSSNALNKGSLEDILTASIDSDFFPLSDSPNTKTNEVVYALIDSSRQGLAYIDLTGRFTYRFTQGNEYILVAYHQDDNAILAEPLRNRQAATLSAAWKKIYNKIETAGAKPKTCVIDNEAS